jgi:hypothetical protein
MRNKYKKNIPVLVRRYGGSSAGWAECMLFFLLFFRLSVLRFSLFLLLKNFKKSYRCNGAQKIVKPLVTLV